jgi:hypothetical protein
MKAKYTPNEIMRSLTFSMIKPLIDNDYEDECYELAYNLHPKAIEMCNLCNYINETHLVKIFLKNEEVYNKCKEINDTMYIFDKFYNVQILMQIIEYINKMEESKKYLEEAKALKIKYNLH